MEDEEESTRVAGPPPVASPPGNVVLPNHLHRSGEIEQRDQGPQPPVGDWEEKTVVDDSQLTNPKAALSNLLQGPHVAEEELTVDEPQKVLSLNLGPSAPKHTVRAQPPPPRSNATGKLVVIAGNDSGREFPLTGKSISVGRGIDNDVVLTDIAVSRKHLSIEFDGTRYAILDAGSGNGTLINDTPGTGPRPLKHGDRLELGNTVFRFEHPTTGAHAPLGQGAAGEAMPGVNPGISVTQGPSGNAGPGARAGAAQYPAAHLPAPQRDGASPGAEPPVAPVASMAAPVAAAPPGFPQGQWTLPTPAQVASSGASSLVLDEVPSGPRAIVGIAATLLAIVALATIGLLLGDDEHFAIEALPAEEIAPLDEATVGPDSAPDTAPIAPSSETNGQGGSEPDIAEPAAQGSDRGDGTGDDDENDGDESSSVDGRSHERNRAPRPGEQRPGGAGKDERAGLLWAPIWSTDDSIMASGTSQASIEASVAAQESAPAAAAAVEPMALPRTPAQARAEAHALYAGKDFGSAAQILHATATKAPKKQAKSLRQLASRYEWLGDHMQRAAALQNRNAGRAMNEYRRAQQLDRALGGAHAAFLRQRLAAVAPQAAASYMNEGSHVQAKRATDVAAQHGAGGHAKVERVRQGLEQLAQKKFEQGNALRRSNSKQAQRLLEEVLRIVPPSSPWHAKAKHLLSLRRKR